jgi:hypothetical protein
MSTITTQGERRDLVHAFVPTQHRAALVELARERDRSLSAELRSAIALYLAHGEQREDERQ